MRKLDPNIPLRPRCDGEDIDRWSPATFSLQAHRLGLAHMVGHGHMIVTRCVCLGRGGGDPGGDNPCDERHRQHCVGM